MATHKHQNEAKLKAACLAAWKRVGDHPLFAPLWSRARLRTESGRHVGYPSSDPLSVNEYGLVFVRPEARWSEEQWEHGFALCLLHLGLGHLKLKGLWTPVRHAAAFVEASRFLSGMKFTSSQAWLLDPNLVLPNKPAAELELWMSGELKEGDLGKCLPYEHTSFCVAGAAPEWVGATPPDFDSAFGAGVVHALEAALDVSAGRRAGLAAPLNTPNSRTPGQRARAHLLAHYPLLSGLAGYFTLVESMDECRKWQVDVGMIDVGQKTIYLNPVAGLSQDEWTWVLAHEYLHAGLNHVQRQDGRDPEIWNVACDFAINSWLEELRIGVRPSIGVMYDPQYKGWSSERIYDHLVTHIRQMRKWLTLAGEGRTDMRGSGEGVDTDADRFCREALVQGMFRHQSLGRGLLPAEMVEAIRALEAPVIPWDVQLGRWFDLHVAYPERRRSYMRPSRRQSAAPDNPLPRTVLAEEHKHNAHTFGVVLDTSGSMSRSLLAKSLGTIAQYALAHEVPGVRLVFCDAQPYDAGYIRPDDLLYEPVRVQGRGGTFLQPAVTFLEQMEDFPEDAPLLILTDGETDVFHIKRPHAFVLPKGKRLPFTPRGDVFYIR